MQIVHLTRRREGLTARLEQAARGPEIAERDPRRAAQHDRVRDRRGVPRGPQELERSIEGSDRSDEVSPRMLHRPDVVVRLADRVEAAGRLAQGERLAVQLERLVVST